MTVDSEHENINADDVTFWEGRYRESNMPWDLGMPAPPFVSLLKESALIPGRVAVLGSGAGHDAALFGKAGFDVVGFDYASGAIALSTERYGSLATFVEASIFEIPEEYWGTFDYVLEHTCFCAILPKRRPEYVQSVLQLLKPGGKLIGLFFAHHEMGGPPYKTDQAELETLFGPYFTFDSVKIPQDSFERRQGEELLCVLSKHRPF